MKKCPECGKELVRGVLSEVVQMGPHGPDELVPIRKCPDRSGCGFYQHIEE